MRHVWICIIVLCHLDLGERASAAADGDARNSFFLEGGGAGLFYSLNYERSVLPSLGIRLGAEYAPLQSTWTAFEAYAVSFPITVNYMGVRRGSHALEIGAGTSLSYSVGEALLTDKAGFEIYGLGVLGYRFQERGGGFQLRVGATSFFGKNVAGNFGEGGGGYFWVWPHLSVGWAF